MSITAMRQALEALEQIDGAMPFPVGRNAIKALRQAIAEAEKAQCDGGTCGLGGYCVDCPKQPLYTHPPKREPLTDEQIMEMVFAECNNMRWPSTALYIARAIEAAHGIKGAA